MGKWLDLLESENSDKTEKCVQTVVSKVSKSPKHPFGTFGTPAHRVFQKNNSEAAKRYAYRFRLHNGEGGGTVLTDEPDLDKARASLAARYGDRLAVVAEA